MWHLKSHKYPSRNMPDWTFLLQNPFLHYPKQHPASHYAGSIMWDTVVQCACNVKYSYIHSNQYFSRAENIKAYSRTAYLLYMENMFINLSNIPVCVCLSSVGMCALQVICPSEILQILKLCNAFTNPVQKDFIYFVHIHIEEFVLKNKTVECFYSS